MLFTVSSPHIAVTSEQKRPGTWKQFWDTSVRICRPILQQYLLMDLQDHLSSYGKCTREQGLIYKCRKRRLIIYCCLTWAQAVFFPGLLEHTLVPGNTFIWNGYEILADVVLIRSCSNIYKLLSSIDSSTLGNRKWDMVASPVQLVKQVSACSYTLIQHELDSKTLLALGLIKMPWR